MSRVVVTEHGPRSVGGRKVPLAPHPVELRASMVSPRAVSYVPATHYADGCLGLREAYLNTQYGCCTEASQWHLRNLREHATDRPETIAADGDILAIYTRDGGMPGDNGCSEDVVLRHAAAQGLPRGDRLAGWAVIDRRNSDLLRWGVSEFVGAVAVGGVPDAWVQTAPGGVWSPAPPNPANGHSWALVDQSSTECLSSSWGQLFTTPWESIAEVCDAAYLLLDEGVLSAAVQRAPDGADWATLVRDLQSVGGALWSPGFLDRIRGWVSGL